MLCDCKQIWREMKVRFNQDNFYIEKYEGHWSNQYYLIKPVFLGNLKKRVKEKSLREKRVIYIKYEDFEDWDM